MSRDIKVLVVDDSANNRGLLMSVLSELEGVEAVGSASDGGEALRLVGSLDPDLVTLDLEMPRMDGFTFLRLMMASRPRPVIVISGYSDRENVFRALELGALDFIAKPSGDSGSDKELRAAVAEKVRMVRQLSPTAIAGRPPPRLLAETTTRKETRPGVRVARHIVCLGASTGGPTAIVEIVSKLPANADVCVLIAQHMPAPFTRTFAERLDRLGGLRVTEASGEHSLAPGTALVCPGGRSLEVAKTERGILARVVAPTDEVYIPSVDRLFTSAANVLGPRVLGVVLTGMGDDGAKSLEDIDRQGGSVLAESAETAVIYGMPGAAAKTGLVNESLPLGRLAEEIARRVRG